MSQKQHERWMHVAIHEALQGLGTTSPNPMVGAVLVHAGKILAKGFHRHAGGPHAEVMAIRACKKIPSGATLYTTLEPCSTTGRTSACTDFIHRSGVRRVVVGSLDPNPIHHARGVKILRAHGIDVVTGIAREACEDLNPAFKKYITRSVPLGIAKMAMSLDGKVATRTGDSKWISSEDSRKLVQWMRHSVDAVLVGAGTVQRDDPSLTLRDKTLAAKKRDFIRVVADARLVVSPRAKIFRPVRWHKTCVATTQKAFLAKGKAFAKRGIEMLCIRPVKNGISMRDLFAQLAKREVTSVLVEGGSTLMASCLQEKVLDRVAFFIAPKIIGGVAAPGPVGGRGVAQIKQAMICKNMRVSGIGSDVLIEARLGD